MERQLNYKHYLLTRFNVPMAFKCKLKNPDENPMSQILNEDYLEKRFKLFEFITLKSVKEQTIQNFKWIVLFHKETPDKYLKKIQELKEIYDFDDVYIGGKDRFSFSKYCVENNINYDFYITTRIDNDDLIDKNYMKFIQEYADKNLHDCFISFANGAKIELISNRTFSTFWENNHFISLISSNHKKSVLDYNHSKISQGEIEVITFQTDVPMWTEVIHDTNVYNRIYGTDKLIKK